MAKRMTDDEVMDYTYNKLFGDLDRIQSGSLFSDKEEATEGKTPEGVALQGIELTVKPIISSQAEHEKEESPEEEEVEEDALKGISKMSPLMSRLHGER